MRRPKLVELPLVPGALTDDTELATKLQASDMDKVRARGNRWETIKGWTAFNGSGMTSGTARGAHQWSTLTGLPVVLAASESAVNAWVDGTRFDVTPYWVDVFLDNTSLQWNEGTNPTITCFWRIYNPATGTSEESPHFLQVGDVVSFSGITGNLGGTVSFDLNGAKTITAVPTPTSFEYIETGTSVGFGGNVGSSGAFVATVAFRDGLATGAGSEIVDRARVWSVDNFGENAVLCGSDGTPVFYWQPASSYPELMTDLSSGQGSGWTYSSGAWTHAGAQSSLSFSAFGNNLVAGKTYELSFAVSIFDYLDSAKLSFGLVSGIDDQTLIYIYPEISSNKTGGAIRTFTARFVCPPSPSDLFVVATDDVKIDTISIKLLSKAHPIAEAPQKNFALFVDGNHVLSVIGSVEADGDFNPLLLRWCAQDNYRSWIPDTDNIAGELILGKGSYAVCGAQVGGQNLILSDTSAYLSAFTDNGYNLQQIGQGCGAVGSRALAVHNNRAFWTSDTGFHAFDGAQVLSIQCPLKDRYVNKLAQYQENKTFSWINSEYGEWWIMYPHTSDGTETSRYLIFSFLEQNNPWSFGTLDRTCMIRAGGFHHPIGIDASGNIWLHETGTSMSGDVTLPFVETGYVNSDGGDRWIGCRRYYPDIKDQVGNINFTITGKRAPQGQNNMQVVGPMRLQPDAAKLDFLITSRQFKFRWESASSTTQWRLGVVGLEMVTERERQ